MSSEVEICKLALSHIRGGTVTDLEADTTGSKACNLWFGPSRRIALADFPWTFSGKSVVLAKQVEVPIEWSFGYAYPPDCLTIRYMTPPGKLRHEGVRIPFEVAINAANIKTILTNQDEACLTYSFDQTDPVQFNPHFVVAMSFQLAVNIAVLVAGASKGRVLRDDANAGYLNVIKAAYSVDSQEGFEGPAKQSDTIDAYGESRPRETTLLA